MAISPIAIKTVGAGPHLLFQGQAGSRAWAAYLGLGLAAIGTYYLLPQAGAGQAIVLTTVNATAAAAAFRTAARTQSLTRVVWVALALAMTCSTLANGPYYAYP